MKKKTESKVGPMKMICRKVFDLEIGISLQE